MYKPLLLSLLSASALGAQMAKTPAIFARQSSCSDYGEKACGTGCIQTTWTCCPDLAGGCDPTTYCAMGTNGEYGCCDIGSTCKGAGGVITSDLPDRTSSGVPQPTNSASGSSSGGSCRTGEKACGDGCIPASDTCCPDQSGSCPVGKYCVLGSNGIWGCCRDGNTCSGAAPSATGGGAVQTSSLPSGSGGTTCGTGKKACGDGCILSTDTCCPDQQGGCWSGMYCSLRNDGTYGCCPDGEVCEGAAGAASSSALFSTSPRSTSRPVNTASDSSSSDYSSSSSSISTNRSTRTSTPAPGTTRTVVTTPTGTGESIGSSPASTVLGDLAAPGVRAEFGVPFFAFGGLFAAQALF